jgi:hypothetical protein
MIRNESSIRITKPADAVFAFVDDVSKAPQWLEYAIEVTQVSPGPKGVGTKLHYVRRGGGAMDGVVTGYEKDRRLAMRYEDRSFIVEIEFRFGSTGAGATDVTHGIAITPKSFLGKLMSPLIRMGNGKQVRNNLARLKGLLD